MIIQKLEIATFLNEPLSVDPSNEGLEVLNRPFDAKNDYLEFLKKGPSKIDAVLVDLDLLKGEGGNGSGYRKGLQFFWQCGALVPVIPVSQPTRIRELVAAVRAGADSYLTYPVALPELRLVIDSIHEERRSKSELNYLRDEFMLGGSVVLAKTQSTLMAKIFEMVKAVAKSDATVLITGETGVGKGVIAQMIHEYSERREKPFLSVHCGAIPENLVESELFGHEKGAFTGAVNRKLGKFEIANNGTIFLDEIGTISSSTQIKLLQVLQEGTVNRVGGERPIKVNNRVIAATNVDLKEKGQTGEFRTDLYYRLNVFSILIPPLRERKEDMELLVELFINKLNRRYGKDIKDIHGDVLRSFQEYDWPGNIRELENVIERAYILENSSLINPESVPLEILQSKDGVVSVALDSSGTLEQMRQNVLGDAERRYLVELMTTQQGRMNKAAEIAGVSTRQLHNLLSKHGIKKEEFKIKN